MKILFISHDATRTGAPLLLLHLMKWIKKNTNYQVSVLLKSGGALESEFASFGGCLVLDKLKYNLNNKITLWDRIKIRFLKKAKSKFSIESYIINKLCGEATIVYANSIACADIIAQIKSTSLPVLLSVHELENVIQLVCKLEDVRLALGRATKIIVGSNMVKDNLRRNHMGQDSKMELVYDFTSLQENKLGSFTDIRKTHNIGEYDFLIAGCGAMQERKGVDLFIEVAKRVVQIDKQRVKFMWVGGDKTTSIFKQMEDLVAQYNLSEYVTLVENVENIHDYYHAFDLFFLSSREDPFPLVCIEAGYSGSPIICFKGCSGTQEIIDESCGGVFDLNKLDEVSKCMVLFKNNPQIYKAASQEISERMKQFDVSKAGPRILELIKNC